MGILATALRGTKQPLRAGSASDMGKYGYPKHFSLMGVFIFLSERCCLLSH
jgi:hypothetical protein